jgi:hypothetical protein
VVIVGMAKYGLRLKVYRLSGKPYFLRERKRERSRVPERKHYCGNIIPPTSKYCCED